MRSLSYFGVQILECKFSELLWHLSCIVWASWTIWGMLLGMMFLFLLENLNSKADALCLMVCCIWTLLECVSRVWDIWNFMHFFLKSLRSLNYSMCRILSNSMRPLSRWGWGTLSQDMSSLSCLNYCVPGCVPQCAVLEVVPYLCPNTWGLWVSLGCLLMVWWLWIIF